MKINGLAIISIPVKDQEIAKNFYHNVFGFEIARESPFKPDAKWIELRIPGSNTTITLVNWFPSMPPGCMRGMVLLSEDVNAAYQILQEKVADIGQVQTAPWGTYFTVNDPDGNGWVIQQMRI
jgi:catechol 2,3-dioxygenase-like lactoylglutathione lyase family enzyme